MPAEIFLHQRLKDMQLVEVELDITVRKFATIHLDEKAFVWIQEADTPLDPDKTLDDAGVKALTHIHVSLCDEVDVKVYQTDRDIERSFSPADTVQTVFNWAVGPAGFKLTDTEAAKHILATCDKREETDSEDHIGHYAGDDHNVCLDLVPRNRFEG